MSAAQERVRRKAVKRRWRIPPPLSQDGNAPGPEGLSVLREIHSELGLLLWKSLRSVTLWADTDPAYRLHLFDVNAADRRQIEILATVPDSEPTLRAALEDLLPILAKPDRADPEFTGLACSRIAAWAEARPAPHTSLEFLQAAALCCPANPGFALATGRAARDLAQYSLAEAWLYRSVGLARQAGDWECYVRAYLQHGTMMLRRGSHPAARRSFLKALRRSRRQGLRDGEGWALHDLFVLESTAGRPDEALAFADQAVAMHGPGHATLPRLAHDVAYFWLEQGYFAHALPVFMSTLGRVIPAARPTVLGSIGRAAAGADDRTAYEWARARLEEYHPAPGVAEAWVEMARGALQLDEHDMALEAARFAEQVARERREGRVRFLAESVMEQIHAERQAMAALAAAGQGRKLITQPTESSDRLARTLLRSLQATPLIETPARVPAGVGG